MFDPLRFSLLGHQMPEQEKGVGVRYHRASIPPFGGKPTPFSPTFILPFSLSLPFSLPSCGSTRRKKNGARRFIPPFSLFADFFFPPCSVSKLGLDSIMPQVGPPLFPSFIPFSSRVSARCLKGKDGPEASPSPPFFLAGLLFLRDHIRKEVTPSFSSSSKIQGSFFPFPRWAFFPPSLFPAARNGKPEKRKDSSGDQPFLRAPLQ